MGQNIFGFSLLLAAILLIRRVAFEDRDNLNKKLVKMLYLFFIYFIFTNMLWIGLIESIEVDFLSAPSKFFFMAYLLCATFGVGAEIYFGYMRAAALFPEIKRYSRYVWVALGFYLSSEIFAAFTLIPIWHDFETEQDPTTSLALNSTSSDVANYTRLVLTKTIDAICIYGLIKLSRAIGGSSNLQMQKTVRFVLYTTVAGTFSGICGSVINTIGVYNLPEDLFSGSDITGLLNVNTLLFWWSVVELPEQMTQALRQNLVANKVETTTSAPMKSNTANMKSSSEN